MDNTINYIKIEDIIPSKLEPHQETTDLELDALTISIQNYGIIQPLVLKNNGEKYEIVLGNRRYKAAKKIGLKKIPAIVLKLNDKEAAEYIMLDNIQRKVLTNQEKEKLYQEVYNKYKIDNNYIKSNLGINNNSNSQSIIINNQNIKSNINNYTYDELNNHNDIININDLNNEELERDEYKMNNEMNNNTINLNNNAGVPNPTNNETPSFGGRFFPSLEDEQTNMNMNMNPGIQMPNQIENQNISPLIDLTDLNNETPIGNPIQSNPQLEPIPNIVNPTLDSLNQQPIPNIPNFNEPQSTIPVSQPMQFEVPQPQSDPAPQIDNHNLEALNQPMQFQMPNQQPQIPNMPNLNQSVQEQFEVQNQEITQPIDIPNFNIPTEQSTLPNTPQVEIQAPVMPSIDQAQPPMEEVRDIPKKDVIPAVNTIKSLVDTLSSLGYILNISESDLETKYNITIEIQK